MGRFASPCLHLLDFSHCKNKIRIVQYPVHIFPAAKVIQKKSVEGLRCIKLRHVPRF